MHGLGRTAARDIELGGQQIKAGERILFLYGSANRDETEFSAPDEFQLDRFPNGHLGFGIGLHRCLGSTLARLMFSTMVGAVLDRMPDYAIDRSRTEHYPSIAAVSGWKALPASFTPGHKRLSKQIIPPWKDVIELGDKDAPGLSDAGAAWAFMALQATRLGLHAAASTSTVRGSTSVPASFRLEDTMTIGRRAGTGRVGETYPLSAYRTPALAFSRVSRTAELRARDIPQLAA
ncbi:MAG TPA: cytochrome P450 [Novosphingobium sp.]